MAVNISGLRRNLKNVAHNYTDAQVKVREATSNDPWGPSSTMMSEIADLTYNVVAFSEIMQMIWKRLNDNGKNWRHVYKALVLLEYSIKTGSEKVAQQCKENIFAIQTLKDFQYLDDNKDQGINVREKAKALVALLKDDERLKNERVRALKAKERFAQSTAGIGSNDTVYNHNNRETAASMRQTSVNYDVAVPSAVSSGEIEAARPQTIGEEELQLQLALAMSREEAEHEETKSKSDNIRLQMALKKSKDTTSGTANSVKPSNDLLDLDFSNPTRETAFDLNPPAPSSTLQHMPAPPTRTAASSLSDPWGMPQIQSDPWGTATAAVPVSVPTTNSDPWSPIGTGKASSDNNLLSSATAETQATVNDPWTSVNDTISVSPSSNNNNIGSADLRASPVVPKKETFDLFSPEVQNQLAEFDNIREKIENESLKNGNTSNNDSNGGVVTTPNPFDVGNLSKWLSDDNTLTPSNANSDSNEINGTKPKCSAVQNILGEHSNLVNLDNLVSESAKTVRNPFEQQTPNPFQAKTQKPPMKDLLVQNNLDTTGCWSNQSATNNMEMNPFF